MAGGENFCLKLNWFEKNIKTSWHELQMEESYCDVIMACEDKQVKTHKLIISSFSPVLRNILKLNQTLNPLIYLKGVKYKDLQNLLNFMYQGQVDVAEDDLSSFLEIAEDLNVLGLSGKNAEVFDSNEVNTSQFPHQNIDSSPKRMVENKQVRNARNHSLSDNMETAGNREGIDFYLKDDQEEISDGVLEKFLEDSGKNKTGDIKSTAIKVRKYKSTKNNNENIVSTLEHKPFSCKKCEKQFSSYSGLYNHRKIVHEGVQYTCDKCEFKAIQMTRLRQHVKSVHEGERYPCDQCHYKTKNKSLLKQHVKSIHEGDCFQCDQCDYKTTFKMGIKLHLKKHYKA